MRRRLAKITVLLLTTALLIGGVIWWFQREPEYQGRPLSEWTKLARSYKAADQKGAREALLAMKDEAVPELADSLVQGETLLEKINRSVGHKLPPKQRRHAMKIFGIGEVITRKTEALEALKLMGTNAQAAVPALAQVLRDPNVSLSSMAGLALGEMGPAAVPELISALDEGDYNVRANACHALQRLGPDAVAAAPRLVYSLENETGPILPVASYTLSRIGPGALPALLPSLSHTNWTTRRWAAYAIGFMVPGEVDPAPHLYPLTRDEHPEVRLVALQTLGRIYISSPEGIQVLRELFADPNPEIRVAAIQAFARAPWMVIKHMDACIELLEDPSPKVRGYAAEALMNVSPLSRSAVPQLEKLAKDEDAFARERATLALKVLRGKDG